MNDYLHTDPIHSEKFGTLVKSVVVRSKGQGVTKSVSSTTNSFVNDFWIETFLYYSNFPYLT